MSGSKVIDRSNNAERVASHNWLRTLALVLVGIGILLSGYLSYVELTKVPIQCIEGGAFQCDVVQSSAYARLAGVPIAYLGLASYILIGFLILFQNRIEFLREYGNVLEFGVVLFAFLFSMWLVYVQVAILEALCQWCLAHEINVTILFIVAIIRLRRSLMSS
jgi:uncharacterized membrane protein